MVPLLQKQDESLLEDVWTLLRAGRLEEACELCRSAGQVCLFSRRRAWAFSLIHFLKLSFLHSLGGLQVYVLLEDWTKSLLLKHYQRMGKTESYKQLNWKVGLVVNGAFGNGHVILPQR